MTSPKREERKKEIALKAMDVFAIHGFHQSSIRTLSAALNISKGTLYDYFESKEDIIVYVSREYLLGVYKNEIDKLRNDSKAKNLSARETVRASF